MMPIRPSAMTMAPTSMATRDSCPGMVPHQERGADGGWANGMRDGPGSVGARRGSGWRLGSMSNTGVPSDAGWVNGLIPTVKGIRERVDS